MQISLLQRTWVQRVIPLRNQPTLCTFYFVSTQAAVSSRRTGCEKKQHSLCPLRASVAFCYIGHSGCLNTRLTEYTRNVSNKPMQTQIARRFPNQCNKCHRGWDSSSVITRERDPGKKTYFGSIHYFHYGQLHWQCVIFTSSPALFLFFLLWCEALNTLAWNVETRNFLLSAVSCWSCDTCDNCNSRTPSLLSKCCYPAQNPVHVD